MKRRTALKQLSALTAGMALFPSCSDKLVIDLRPEQVLSFNNHQSTWINAISDAILPKKDLVISTLETFPEFVSKMMVFSKTKQDQESFISGYNLCTKGIKDMYNTSTSKIMPGQVVSYFSEILEGDSENSDYNVEAAQMSADKKYFCQTIRNMSIWHLTTSKEYQEGVLEYKLIPDFYNGCVEV